MNAFESTLKKYLTTFADQEMYFTSDQRNLEFFEKNPTNTKAEDIRLKIGSVDATELTKQNLTEDMVNHILRLNTDERIKKGDLSIVDAIATLSTNGQTYRLLHFASLYCNLHRPDVFPIYSEEHFAFYKSYIKHFNLPLDAEQLTSYSVFCQVLNDLVKRLELQGKMNYLQLRKFGWLYGETVLKEANVQY